MASLITHPTRVMKSRDVTIRLGAVTDVNRPNVTYKPGTDRTEIYRIDNGKLAMYEFQGATTSDSQKNDDESTFRYIGDSGWTDGVITNSRMQMSITANALKNLGWAGDEALPHYYADKGKFDEAQMIVKKFENNVDFEAWLEIYELIDQIDNGVTIYNVQAFAGSVMSPRRSYPADGLVEISFDFMSRGEAYQGFYQAINPVRTGLPNKEVYSGLPAISTFGSIVRQVKAEVTVGSTATAVPLADTLTGVALSSDVTFKYQDGAAAALTELVAAGDLVSRPKARLVKVSDRSFVPCAVTANTGSGTIVLNPSSDLDASTQYFAEVETGAMLQKVDGSNAASSSGTAKPLIGLRTGIFTTAAS